VLLLPVSSVLSKENVQKNVHKIQLYDRVATIMTQQWLEFLKPQISASSGEESRSFFDSFLQAHAKDIVQAEWVGEIGDQVIDEVFDVLQENGTFDDFEIDIFPIKLSFLQYVARSEAAEEISVADIQIPDSVWLSDLFGVSVVDVSMILEQLRQYLVMIKFLNWVLGVLFFVCMGVFFLFFSAKVALRWIFGSLLIGSLPLLIFPLVFKFYLLSDSFLNSVTYSQSSSWQKLVLLISLSFLEDMTNWWTIISLVIFALVMVYFVRLVLLKDFLRGLAKGDETLEKQ
jgi:hypothetical protein